jgi:hypothetical protein
MISLGGAVAGGSRIALTRGVDPTRFADEVHRYGATVVSYTWAMLLDLVEATSPELQEHHPIRLTFLYLVKPRAAFVRAGQLCVRCWFSGLLGHSH